MMHGAYNIKKPTLHPCGRQESSAYRLLISEITQMSTSFFSLAPGYCIVKSSTVNKFRSPSQRTFLPIRWQSDDDTIDSKNTCLANWERSNWRSTIASLLLLFIHYLQFGRHPVAAVVTCYISTDCEDFTVKFRYGGLHEKHVVATGNCQESSQHLLKDPGKPRKTWDYMAGHRTFRVLTFSQSSGI